MSLTECRECGDQVSDEADHCPHCGVPDPAGTGSRPASKEQSAARTDSSSEEESGGCLGTGLVAVGVLWGLIGVGNIVVGFGNISEGGGGEGMMGANLMINMLLFVLPALVVAGLGGILRKR